jgi:deoxyribose-phosphate aldolase
MSGSSGQSIDALVDTISQRVAQKLKLASPTSEPGYDPDAPCDADADTCNSCGFCATRKEPVIDKLISIGATGIGAGPGGKRPSEKIARLIDHTLLKPETTNDDLRQVCEEARKWNFATVCVNAANIPLVARELKGSGVKPIAVVGFPLGASTGAAKAFEAREAVRNGAQEIDTVINIGALKSKDYATVLDDLCKVVQASKPKPVKVILETSMLNNEQKTIGCALSKAAGAAFVKTSTGFGGGGATVEDVLLMRNVVGDDMLVKASGGMRSREDVDKMVKAGANRIGASASVAIVTGKKSNTAY